MLEKIYKICIFFIFGVVAFTQDTSVGQGIGDLDINISMTPAPKVKKYPIKDTILLDTGTQNTGDLKNSFIGRQKIADVVVTMQTRKSNNNNSKQYCIIDGDFNGLYKIKNIENFGKKEIETNAIHKYKETGNLNIKLYQENFKLSKSSVILEEDLSKPTYTFVAYPEECEKISEEKPKNLIVRLIYSFEIWMEISGANVGDKVRIDVAVDNQTGTNEAVGAIKDLVKDHFRSIQ